MEMSYVEKEIKTHRWFEDAEAECKKQIQEDPHRIFFIMQKAGAFAVFKGWGGRDEAISQGWRCVPLCF